MSTHYTSGRDTGAAFRGLIFGAAFIGAILYGIVVLTNRQFESHKPEAKPAAATGSTA